ncbi:acyl-CoA dehydrogenase family protein [Spongiactinospora sp. TRM90649]|uniref:acyl-CoA dehydrogenase family protein n=1 Tax=Spongiactinospora sp. TRM90649 TaxID=3031114 RepID=UPI0023F90ADD|nr:acyl-CoA dehydrogenase family protein [Spongiactinospora sp. TRM90649]MDF5753451.1 acyl-CoA dehydrogenase family protein [Spongiactinospora sp. TRM90649]
MDLRDSPEEARFRARLCAWLKENLPADPEPTVLAERWPYMREFQQRLYRSGWVALSYPKQVGGQGLGPMEEAILSEELGKANAPSLLPLGHLGRPLLSYGTDEQRRRYLPPLLASDEIWCQGFSEPQAGSDLASLRTRAVRKGDEWVLNGHKIWTSYAAFADFCLLLARTDPDAVRHRGISAFIVPLSAPGVTVRPIVLANGDEEFAEIFLDDVRIPEANILGRPTDGWRIAMDVVNYERGAVETGYLPKFERYLSELAAVVKARTPAPDRAVLRALGETAAALEVLRMHCLRTLSDRVSGASPGPESSIDKLLMTAVEQKLMALSLSLLTDTTAPGRAEWFDRYLYGRAGSIYGGSAQIQRNILAERLLGLPRSPG